MHGYLQDPVVLKVQNDTIVTDMLNSRQQQFIIAMVPPQMTRQGLFYGSHVLIIIKVSFLWRLPPLTLPLLLFMNF